MSGPKPSLLGSLHRSWAHGLPPVLLSVCLSVCFLLLSAGELSWPREHLPVMPADARGVLTTCQAVRGRFLYPLICSSQQPGKQDGGDPHFTDQKSETQRNEVTCVRSHSPEWQAPSGLVPVQALNCCCKTQTHFLYLTVQGPTCPVPNSLQRL